MLLLVDIITFPDTMALCSNSNCISGRPAFPGSTCCTRSCLYDYTLTQAHIQATLVAYSQQPVQRVQRVQRVQQRVQPPPRVQLVQPPPRVQRVQQHVQLVQQRVCARIGCNTLFSTTYSCCSLQCSNALQAQHMVNVGAAPRRLPVQARANTQQCAFPGCTFPPFSSGDACCGRTHARACGYC
jgi:hypothetical protein